ncbi:hypothetical protein BGZ63DRAFT_66120 [Mariannaea sp. PMI_226]|nr:hypothetical protein BGZ63DRAFT_66120 [Mariannaea sp. PMI_226]
MSASLVHSRRKRWQGEARQINGKDLPVWAMSEESDYEDYEANTVKKTRRVGRDSEADPNVKMAKIYGSRQRRDDNFPGYSFREHSKPVERRGPPGGDLPGDSLRESLVDPAPTNRPEPPGRTAQSDADTTFYITGNDNVPESTRAYSSRVSTSTTLSTYTSTYTSSKSAEETGSSDSDSDGEGEGTTTSSSLVPTAPAAASSALPSGHNVMVS